ncbi:hypothetical protein [uncultured Proteiniphilum sp.]|nr:hypothetical protein [uncultured Proteiniphilum sp.]
MPEEIIDKGHDWEEVYERGLDKLSELYDTDIRKLAEENDIKLQ